MNWARKIRYKYVIKYANPARLARSWALISADVRTHRTPRSRCPALPARLLIGNSSKISQKIEREEKLEGAHRAHFCALPPPCQLLIVNSWENSKKKTKQKNIKKKNVSSAPDAPVRRQ
jgi:hypothetical protein